MTDNPAMTFHLPPAPNARFCPPDSNLVWQLHGYPNAWHRFWQRVFFGFSWERM